VAFEEAVLVRRLIPQQTRLPVAGKIAAHRLHDAPGAFENAYGPLRVFIHQPLKTAAQPPGVQLGDGERPQTAFSASRTAEQPAAGALPGMPQGTLERLQQPMIATFPSGHALWCQPTKELRHPTRTRFLRGTL